MDTIRGSDNLTIHPRGILCESQYLAREGPIGVYATVEMHETDRVPDEN
ncbi:hypothetical protein Gotur_011412 [Gossypium turneri]